MKPSTPEKGDGSPFRRIHAPQRPKRTTRKRNEHGNKHRSVLEDLGRSGAKTQHQTENGAKHPRKRGRKSVLQDSSTSTAKTDHQKEKRARQQTQARDRENQRAGEVRFGGFGPLSGQSGAPNREWSNAFQGMGVGEVRFAGFKHLSGQNGPPERETSPATNTGQR